jgi:hypothetical protein
MEAQCILGKKNASRQAGRKKQKNPGLNMLKNRHGNRHS